MEANLKVGWAFQKPIPSFSNSISDDGYWDPLQNPVIVQCVPGLIWVVTPSPI